MKKTSRRMNLLLPKLFVFCLILLVNFSSSGQKLTFSGRILNSAQTGIPHARVILDKATIIEADSMGNFVTTTITPGNHELLVQADGFISHIEEMTIYKNTELVFVLAEQYFSLEEIVVESSSIPNQNLMTKVDLAVRPVNSSQDLLRLVPGLFTSQHAGGGKAEQIFFRGFDVDHGTDFAIYVDGMPVNMTSHAHGQGYADLHFLIPETVKDLEVNKGPYTAQYGDLATSGSGEFTTLYSLEKNTVSFSYGMFNTQRALAMINLLNNKHLFSTQKENLYIAGEYRFTDSYFNSNQNFKRYNFFAKYTGVLKNGSELSFSGSTFQSNWNASGQIPSRKVEDGTINRFGSIDDTEGGITSRTNFNIKQKKISRNTEIIHQAYYCRYDFNLFSNFTFFLNDEVNGDQIQQGDHRNIAGYNGTVKINGSIGTKKLVSTIGNGFRYDNSFINLSHTLKREFLNDMVKGKLKQLNAWTYLNEDLFLTAKLKANLGTRFDFYNFNFTNYTHDTASGTEIKALVSPKLNFTYTLNQSVELYAKSGFGFHSNDARAVVVGSLENTLARAFGYETGSTFKPYKKLLVNLALWSLQLQSELVYVGDEGIVEASGRTLRYGVDFGIRYQLGKYWFVDADVNLNKGKLVDEPEDANRIPLAPTFTSIGGISYKRNEGFNGSMRYRYMSDRAATENNSIIAKGYFLVDAVLNYTTKKFQVGITVENLLNKVWNEAQFATESRLQDEPMPVNELHYTPGTPFFLRGGLTFYF